MNKREWNVEGMTCANCALTISKYLEKQGLNEVKVNIMSGEVSFSSPNDIFEEKLRKGIKALGYKVADINVTAPQKYKILKTPLQKFWFCLPFTFFLWLPMISIHLHWLMNSWVQLVLTLPVVVVGMAYFGKSALKSILNGIPNMNVLISLGAASAFIYSFIGTIQNLGNDYLYFESAATIITIVLLGYWMEEVSIAKTQEVLRSLSGEQKIMANMIAFDDQHKEQIFPVEGNQLRIGDLILIKSGEQVPMDCKILWGECTVNESIITGESLPLEKYPKDFLVGGSILENGIAKAQVTATGHETVLAKIIDLAKQAQAEKAPIQKLADRISAVFVPIVLALAIVTFVTNYLLLHVQLDNSLMRSIAVLVIACPCAMGLATPAAIAVGLGRAAKNGILYKDAKSLEQFKNIRQIVFDKTGTITTGKFVIANFTSIGCSENQFKSICYSLEKFSNHPLSKVITKEWKGSDLIKWKQIEEIKGLGLKATDNHNNYYLIGSYQIVKHISNDPNHSIYVLKNDTLIGWIDVADEIRSEAKNIIDYFKKRGIKTFLLSGDSIHKCIKVKDSLGIDEMYAEQSPKQKVEIIERLIKVAATAMIGDGINDAAALAKATVGIAISDASHIAIQNANVVLVNNGMKNLPKALQLGQYTYTTIRQNLFWAFFYNIVAIPIAASGFLTPGIAAFAMGLSDVLLLANSLRLKWKKLE